MTAKLGMTDLANGAGNQLIANANFELLAQLVQAGALDKDLSTPPGSPANGALYIVASGNWGTASDKTGRLAYWLTSAGAWSFLVPSDGWMVWVADEAKRYEFKAGAWAVFSSGSGGISLPVVQTFTGAKTLALADINTYNVSQDAGAQAVTLLAQGAMAWTADAEIHIERGAAGAVTVVGAAGVQINGTTAGTFTLGAQYSVVTLKRKSANLWTLFGNAS